MDLTTLGDLLEAQELNWLETNAQRKLAYELGMSASPISPVCRRGWLPNVQWPGGRVDPDLLFDLIRIDAGFEIIYDRYSTIGAAPGHHLYRRVGGDGTGAGDILIWEVSLQWEMNKIWPEGKPREPGRWLIPCILQNLKGPDDTPEKLSQARRDRCNANRAKKIKKGLEAELRMSEALAPYFERGRKIPKVGHGGWDGRPADRNRAAESGVIVAP